MTTNSPSDRATPPPSVSAAMSSPDSHPKLVFNDIAGGAKEILIEHAGQTYRLRLTRNDKLILNK